MDCPYIETHESCCSEYLNMGHLEAAFAFCTDRYTRCPVYIELSGRSMSPLGGGIVDLEGEVGGAGRGVSVSGKVRGRKAV